MKQLTKGIVNYVNKIQPVTYTSIIFNLNSRIIKNNNFIKNKKIKNIDNFIKFITSLVNNNITKETSEYQTTYYFILEDNGIKYILSIRSSLLNTGITDDRELPEYILNDTTLTVYSIHGVYLNHFRLDNFEDFIAYISLAKFYPHSRTLKSDNNNEN